MLMDEVLLGKHSMFNVEQNKARPQTEKGAFLVINEDYPGLARNMYEDLGKNRSQFAGDQVYALQAFRDSISEVGSVSQNILDRRYSPEFTNEAANEQYSRTVKQAKQAALQFKKSVLGDQYRTTDYSGMKLNEGQKKTLVLADRFLNDQHALPFAAKREEKMKSANAEKNRTAANQLI